MKIVKGVLLVVSLLALVPLLAETQHLILQKDSLAVYDSNGKKVGTIIDTTFSAPGYQAKPWIPTIALSTGQLNVFLGVYPDRFIGNSFVLYFSSTDCSGAPYFPYPPPSSPPSLISQTFVKNDGTVYAGPGNSTASTVVFISSGLYQGDNFPPSEECRQVSYNYEVIQAQELGNINDMFQAPFVLK